MSGPRRLKDLLSGWKPKGAQRGSALADDLAAAAFAAAWAQAVGSDIARRSRPIRFRAGVLTVLTASSAWSDELSLHAPKILVALRRAYPQEALHKLRLLVASGRSNVLFDVARRRTEQQTGPTATSVRHTEQPQRHTHEDVPAVLKRLAAEQTALDAQRDRSGWKVCAACGRRYAPHAQPGRTCAVCSENQRRRIHASIERALMQAPWLSLAQVRRALPATTATAFDRTRSRLLARWQADVEAAERRVRRGAVSPEDRVVAWSYLMLASGMAQRHLGRAVVEGMLGPVWTTVLFGDVTAQKQEARRSSRENLK